MYKKKEDLSKIRISCDCGEIDMEIIEATWNDNSKDYYIDFKISSFYSGQSVIGIIKERIKLAWLALRKGNYYFQSMEVKKDTLLELKNNLNELLP